MHLVLPKRSFPIWILASVLWFTWGDRGMDGIYADQSILALKYGRDVASVDPLIGHAFGPFIFAPVFGILCFKFRTHFFR